MDKISWSLVLLRSSLVLDVVSLPGVSVTELKLAKFSSESSNVFTYCMTVSVLACMICAAKLILLFKRFSALSNLNGEVD